MKIQKSSWHYRFITPYFRIEEDTPLLMYGLLFILSSIAYLFPAVILGLFVYLYLTISPEDHFKWGVQYYVSIIILVLSLTINRLNYKLTRLQEQVLILIYKQIEVDTQYINLQNECMEKSIDLLEENNKLTEQTNSLLHYKERCDTLTKKLEELNISEIDDLK
jgi:hypothetical protein